MKYRKTINVPVDEIAEAEALGALPLGDGVFGIPYHIPLANFMKWSDNIVKKPQEIKGLSAYLNDIASGLKIHAPPVTEVICNVDESHISASGNVYLWLSDGDSACRAMVWSRDLHEVFSSGVPQIGERGTCHVHCDYSPVWGMRLLVSAWKTIGNTGARMLPAHLNASSMPASLALPPWISRIALLAPDGAGVEDFNVSVGNIEKSGLLHIKRYTAIFEGPGSTASLINAFKIISQHNDIDVVYMVRGGGSPSSLAWLDNPEVLIAAAALPFPLVTGLGHERDTPLLEKVATLAFGTPSKAGQHLCDICMKMPSRTVSHIHNIKIQLGKSIQIARNKLHVESLRLEACHPDNIINRGYAIVTHIDGSPVTPQSRGRIKILTSNGEMEAELC